MNMYKDFDKFSRALIATKDVDPLYPFIKSLLKHNPDYQREWFVLVYVMFYSLESAIKFCNEMPTMDNWHEGVFRRLRNGWITKMGHERRGKQRTIDNQILMIKTFMEYLESGDFQLIKLDDNKVFRKRVETWPQHSGWASFKIAEVFEKALDHENLAVIGMGLEGRDPNSNDGPVGGLRWLYGREHEFDQSILNTWEDFGSNLHNAWGVDIGEVESCLCKWHKMMTGKYYIGHDIDELWELKDVVGWSQFSQIMAENFHHQFLTLRHGIDKKSKGLYKDTGQILNAKFAIKLPEADVLQILLES